MKASSHQPASIRSGPASNFNGRNQNPAGGVAASIPAEFPLARQGGAVRLEQSPVQFPACFASRFVKIPFSLYSFLISLPLVLLFLDSNLWLCSGRWLGIAFKPVMARGPGGQRFSINRFNALFPIAVLGNSSRLAFGSSRFICRPTPVRRPGQPALCAPGAHAAKALNGAGRRFVRKAVC